MKQRGLKKRIGGFIADTGRDWRSNYQLYLLAMPFMILFFLFVIVPVVMAIALSFTYYNMIEIPQWRGIDNYLKMFLDDNIFGTAFVNTLKFAVITGPVGYMLSFIIAWLINELTPKVRSVVTLIFYTPALTGNVYFIWLYIFSGDRYGFINNILLQSGLILEPVQWLESEQYMMNILIIVQLWLSLGISFLSFIAGLQSVDRTMYEAAAIDGVRNRWQELWYVTLPMMKPQLLFGAVMQINSSFSVGAISQALLGFPSKNYAGHTIVLHIMDYGTTRYEMGYACALTVVLFLMMLVFKSFVSRVLARVGE